MDRVQLDDNMTDDNQEVEIDLIMLAYDSWKLIKKYKKIFCVVILTIIVAYTSWTYFSYVPRYRCSASFTVATSSNGGSDYGFSYSSNTADQLSKTFPYILESNYFKSVLLEELATSSIDGTISAETLSESNIVTMSVESTSAQDAMDILTKAIDIYPTTAHFVLGDIQFQMINNPVKPEVPFNKPVIIKVLAIGGGAGVIVSLLIIAIMALFKRTIRTVDQMNKISNLKCLATLPEVTFKARKHRFKGYISIDDRRVPYSYKESFRSLYIRMHRELKKTNGKVIMVTSTLSGEGKSTVAINLAKTMAENGKKVLLIDLDLRKPSIARYINQYSQYDVTEFIDKTQNIINDLSILSTNLYFISAKQSNDNPVEILSQKRFKEALDLAKQKVDYVVLDTPPCGIFQDACIIQEWVDGILYVVRSDYIPQQKIVEGLASLSNSNCYKGYLFNYFDYHVNHYGYGRYGYGQYYNYGGYGYRQKDQE